MPQYIHILFEVGSYIVGYRYYLYLRERHVDLISDKDRIEIFLVACFGAMVGSKLLGILEDVSVLSRDFLGIAQTLLGTKTIVGGLLGGLICVESYKRLKCIKVSSGDLMTYPLILGMIIGRFGCHFTALEDGTFGLKTSFFTGMDFGDGIKRHPTNLYEITFLLLIWLLIGFLEKKRVLADGAKFKIFLSSYFLFRFIVDFIKPRDEIFEHLSAIQIACLLGVCYYCYIFITSKTFLKPNDF
jgi:phosphatidylglycerol---prolipoprotein diacylglyceryl transferase